MEKKVQKIKFVDTSKMKLKKVAAYARVSTNKDEMLHSLAAQISYYSAMINNVPDWEYVGVYSDEGITGTKEERNGFQDLIDDCKEGKIDIIITKSISRFARNTVTFLNTVRYLKTINVDVYFEEQNIHSLSADGELMLTLLASFAQAESLSASENQKWRIRKSFEKGELMNLRYMFGYKISKGKVEINNKEAKIVRRIYKKFIGGESLISISNWLNEKGIKGVYGGKFTSVQVSSLIKNEKYTGNALLQKVYRNNHLEKKLLKNNGELPRYYAENTHPAIIDMETYEMALKKLEEISYTRGSNTKSVFSSRIVCSKCGEKFIRAYNRKTVWICRTYKEKGKKCCDAKQIPDYILKDLSCEVLSISVFDEDLVDEKIERIEADSNGSIKELTFFLSDGTKVTKEWDNPSRSESWTDEMKEQARIKELNRRKINGSK